MNLASTFSGVMRMGRDLFAGGEYLSDKIRSRIAAIAEERSRLLEALAAPGPGFDPEAGPELARRFNKLDRVYHLFIKMENLQRDLNDLGKMACEGGAGDTQDLRALHAEITRECEDAARRLYLAMLEEGFVCEETVDGDELEVLKFIEYAGPEYAWRLGINIGVDTKEARERIERLLEKGLLEKVQGTMLEGYHREKDWVKHMNHTYYRLSRKGKLFLRQLRRGPGQNL